MLSILLGKDMIDFLASRGFGITKLENIKTSASPASMKTVRKSINDRNIDSLSSYDSTDEKVLIRALKELDEDRRFLR